MHFILCLDTRQPGSVFNILHIQQSEIILSYSRISTETAHPILLKTVDLCLEMLSDFNNDIGFRLKKSSPELGISTRKSRCFDTNLDSRARLFKKLDTRQSKIHE